MQSSPRSIFFAPTIGAALFVIAHASACDRGVASGPGSAAASAPAPVSAPAPASASASASGSAPAPASASAAATPVGAAAPANVVAAAPPPEADCTALAKHVDAVLRATGSAREKSTLPSVEAMQRNCETDTNHPAHMACFLAATDSAAFAQCNRNAFPGKVDATPTRKFDALRDNSSASPPVLTQDGDYLAYDEHCGMLFKEVAPAAAIYVACNGRAEIGPLVTIDEFDNVVKMLAAQEDQRHRIVMSFIAKTRVSRGVPVQVYDTDGTYRGIEYR